MSQVRGEVCEVISVLDNGQCITPSWASDVRSPDRVPVLCVRGFVTPPHRAAAGGPPEDEDGRGGPGRALGGVKVSVSMYVSKETVQLWWGEPLWPRSQTESTSTASA